MCLLWRFINIEWIKKAGINSLLIQYGRLSIFENGGSENLRQYTAHIKNTHSEIYSNTPPTPMLNMMTQKSYDNIPSKTVAQNLMSIYRLPKNGRQ